MAFNYIHIISKLGLPKLLQVLFDLFRHDARLWKAYCFTLQVYLFMTIDKIYIEPLVYCECMKMK